MGGPDTVGAQLAAIADLLADGLRILDLGDKRHWGPDEHEQRRALDEALGEASRDFQGLAPLVHGQAHYEHDRRHESVEELRALRARFGALVDALRDWARSGGPIDAVWVRHTHALQRQLHRAQCRAARRIFTSGRESSRLCLGAFLVRRARQRAPDARLAPRAERAACAAVGAFERLGDDHVAFVCDFCDGHLVWEDLEAPPMPEPAAPAPAPAPAPASTTTKTAAAAAAAATPRWLVPGRGASDARERPVLAAPVAVANHAPPPHGHWQAALLCPLCEEAARRPSDEDDEDGDVRPDGDDELDDVAALQEHLELRHAVSAAAPSPGGCVVM